MCVYTCDRYTHAAYCIRVEVVVQLNTDFDIKKSHKTHENLFLAHPNAPLLNFLYRWP